MKFGLVVEGKDDAALIAACVQGELARLGLGLPSFEQLQPPLDATGQIESGGWAKVLGWIINYSGSSLETFFVPLFSSNTACDAIIVHLDSDIHADLLKNLASPPVKDPSNFEDLVNHLEIELRKALNCPKYDGKVCFAIPVHKSENWIMAGSPVCQDSRWSDEDAKRVIRTLFDSANHISISDMINKMISDISLSTDNLYSRAISYRPFRDKFEKSL